MLRAPYSRFSSFLDGSGSKRTSRRARPLLHAPTPQHRTRTICHGEEVRRECCCCAAHSHATSSTLLIIFLPLFSSFLLFNVYAVQCSAVPLCAAPLHCRLCVHAAMLVCSWEERSRRRIPPPLPPPFLFFSRPHSSVAYRTQLQRCTIGARTTTLHQLCSSTIAACVS